MSSSFCQFGEIQASMSSGWVEDFLIELFLEGPSGGHCTGGTTDLQAELEENVRVDGDLSANIYGTDAQTSMDLRNAQDACEPQQQQAECLEEASVEDEKMLEAWQAQYGQVVRSDGEAEACPGAISLWNWITIVSKGKCKAQTSICLLGQLAQTLSRLHDSLQHHNGFVRTSDVCEVNLDLVKVSSGEIFRLRQPSLKYLASVTLYDSSNPTKDWGFPCLTLSGLEETAECSETVACVPSANSSVAKPFLPNWNHQRYQHLKEKKLASPAIPAGLRALSGKEIDLADKRKRKYRDRAKERRELYGGEKEGFECGMHYTKHELSSSAKDTDNAMEVKPKRPSIGRQMLERMGWFEGESIGTSKNGLITPLDAAGNHNRAGIGWVSPHEKRGNG